MFDINISPFISPKFGFSRSMSLFLKNTPFFLANVLFRYMQIFFIHNLYCMMFQNLFLFLHHCVHRPLGNNTLTYSIRHKPWNMQYFIFPLFPGKRSTYKKW